MRSHLALPLAAATLFCLAGGDALAQVERGGGLFSRNRNTPQISAGLFPDDPGSPSTAPAASRQSSTSSPRERRGGLNIFRSGRPEPVEPTSYVIAEGQRIPVESGPGSEGRSEEETAAVEEAPAAAPARPGIRLASDRSEATQPQGLGGLLPFGRRESQRGSQSPPALVETVAAPVAENAAPVAETVSVASSETPPEASPAPVAAPVAAPAPGAREQARERQPPRLAMPFFNRRSRPEAVETPDFADPEGAPLVAQQVEGAETPNTASPEQPAPAPAATAAPRPSGTVAAASSSSSGAPAASSGTSAETARTAEPEETEASGDGGRPEFVMTAPAESEGLPSSERSGGGISIPSIPNPITAIRPIRTSRPVDLSNAETIIEGGQIVAESRPVTESNVVTAPSSGQREAPRTVEGVTTYSSWGDVGGRSVSAADRILSQMR